MKQYFYSTIILIIFPGLFVKQFCVQNDINTGNATDNVLQKLKQNIDNNKENVMYQILILKS